MGHRGGLVSKTCRSVWPTVAYEQIREFQQIQRVRAALRGQMRWYAAVHGASSAPSSIARAPGAPRRDFMSPDLGSVAGANMKKCGFKEGEAPSSTIKEGIRDRLHIQSARWSRAGGCGVLWHHAELATGHVWRDLPHILRKGRFRCFCGPSPELPRTKIPGTGKGLNRYSKY